MDSVILLSVLSFSDGLNLLKEFGASVILSLFVLECFTPTVPERMSTISVLQKFRYVYLDMLNVFPFLFELRKLECSEDTQECYFSDGAFF